MKKLLALLVFAGGVTGCASVPDSVMIAQGQTARVQLNNALYMDVGRSTTLPPEQIKKDIRACKDQGEGSLPKATVKAYEWTGVLSQQDMDRWADVFASCMQEKGYQVTRWDPRDVKPR